MFFSFLLELRIPCQLKTWCPRVSSLFNSVDHKRDPGYENGNEVTNSETLNSQNSFSQDSCKVTSFSLVLDLIHECYVILFSGNFYFLNWKSTYFVAYFYISTSQKLRGNEIGILFLTLKARENNEKLKLSSTNKTHVYSLLVNFDVLRLYVVTEKSYFLGSLCYILIYSNPQILQICFLQPFSVKTWRVNLIKLSSN